MSQTSVRIGRRYRPNRVKDRYDVLIIGSGIGGLTSAVCLADLGYSVCILEQHYTLGGFTHSYERAGYEWDVGVHYIGDMGSTKTTGRKVFDYVSHYQLKWEMMDTVYDHLFLGNDEFKFRTGRHLLVKDLKLRFPDEHHAIDQYFSLLKKMNNAVKMWSVAKIAPKYVMQALRLFGLAKQPKFMNKTTREVLESITDNQTLIAVLTTQWGDCGLPPAQSSFMIHSLIAQHYLHGGYYPIGGSSNIARTIVDNLTRLGGQSFTYANVTRINCMQNKATGVTMEDGTVINADTIISNAGVFNTYEKLLKRHSDNLIQGLERSMASVCLYLGLSKDGADLNLPKTNWWIYPSKDYEHHVAQFKEDPELDFPLVFISFPSVKDPQWSDRYPNKSTIEIVAPTFHELFSKWSHTTWNQRGEEYETMKESISQRLIKELLKRRPDLEQYIEYYELSTTLSTDYFCRYDEGQIYGLNHTPQRFLNKDLKPKTTIDGLYLTGQDVLSCGVVGALMSGYLTAIAVAGPLKSRKLITRII